MSNTTQPPTWSASLRLRLTAGKLFQRWSIPSTILTQEPSDFLVHNFFCGCITWGVETPQRVRRVAASTGAHLRRVCFANYSLILDSVLPDCLIRAIRRLSGKAKYN